MTDDAGPVKQVRDDDKVEDIAIRTQGTVPFVFLNDNKVGGFVI